MKLLTQKIRSFKVVAFASCIAFSASSHADENKKFEKLLDEHWQYFLQTHPFQASDYGDLRYNDKLPDNSLEGLAAHSDFQSKLLTKLAKLNLNSLTPKNQLNYELLTHELNVNVGEHIHKTDLFNITNRSGPHLELVYFLGQAPLFTDKDHQNYIKRLQAVPEFMAHELEVAREAVSLGLVQSCESMAGYENSIATHVVKNPEDSKFYEPFLKLPNKFSEERKTTLQAQAKAAIKESVIPQIALFGEFYAKEYQPNCAKIPGASNWPKGDELYQFLVGKYTTTELTADEVHNIGLSEVKRIRDEMIAAIKQAEFDGGLQEFIQYLRTDKQFYAKTPEELVAHVSTIAKKMDGELPKLFGKLPRNPYGIKEVPADIAEKTTTAYYSPGAADGSRAGFYYINTSLLEARPLYTLEALTLHEAVPGHHLQIALAYENDVPNFRRDINNTVFIEGWGLYAERLGLEVGFYDNPYTNFGRLSYEMWRALRLVVDTGIHAKGWTRQQAIDFMAENSALSLHNITAEVDRYITWPGQALAYKMGELKIRELREKAEQKLGAQFDVRAFHDALLENGAVPLSILEELMDKWLATQSG
ncbi:DUF885 domain-containing protein [Sessilibacter sp. MAH4]